MWSLLPKKWQLIIVLAAGFLILRSVDAAQAYLQSDRLTDWNVLMLSATAIGTGLVFLGNKSWRWLWSRIPGLDAMTFPDLNGIWTGEVISTWINPDTLQGIAPIPITITIRQSLFSVSVSLKTAESESHSKHVTLERLTEINRSSLVYLF